MPTIRLRLAHGQQFSSGMDAAGQGEFDLTAGQLSVARNSGPCCGCSWPAAERQSDQLAERLLPEEPSSTYFSDGRRMDCLWAAAVSDRNGEASVERRASVVWRASVIRAARRILANGRTPSRRSDLLHAAQTEKWEN